MRLRSFQVVALMAAAVVGSFNLRANANLVTFTATDSGAGPNDPTPNSNAASASYQTAAATLGSGHYINFESAPVGSFTNLTIAPGVTINGTDYVGLPQSIMNVPSGSPSNVYGFNTTPGGANYVDVNAGTLTFSFATPIAAFGSYLSGVQLDGETITFSDGTTQTITIPDPGSTGGVDFVGFTDASKSISSLEIITPNPTNNAGDFIGVDDVRYTTAGATPPVVPLPKSVWGGLVLLGCLGLSQLRRKIAAL